jgi:hypothetical protein
MIKRERHRDTGPPGSASGRPESTDGQRAMPWSAYGGKVAQVHKTAHFVDIHHVQISHDEFEGDAPMTWTKVRETCDKARPRS